MNPSNQTRVIKYVCNPVAYCSTNVVDKNTEIRKATLFCMVCSFRANITEENFKTLPFDVPADQFESDHSPLYSGKCLKPECTPRFAYKNNI